MRVLVTNVTHYAGPGTIPVLLDGGSEILCHDSSFVDPSARAGYADRYPGVLCLDAQTPEEIHAAATRDGLTVDGIVSNDVYPITHTAIEEIPLDDLRSTFEAVLVFPFRLTQLFLPAMQERRSGTFVFITSARPRQAEPGFAVPTTVRAGASAFALALARETARFGIQVNVVAPNYLYSEMYYPVPDSLTIPQDGR